MSPKRVRSDSPSSPPTVEKKHHHLASAIPPNPGDSSSAGQGQHLTQKAHLGMVSVCTSDEDEPMSPKITNHSLKNDLGIIVIGDSDDDATAMDDTARGGGASGGRIATPGGLGDVVEVSGPLLGLHEELQAQKRAVHALLHGPVGDGFVKLTDIPEDAGWNDQSHLGDMYGRAFVIVAFGTLHFTNLQFGLTMLPSFSVEVELFRELDRDVLQRVLDLAEPNHKQATRRLAAFRAAPDERSRLLNIYDCTECDNPNDEGQPCGINELVAGDVVRVVMRCVKDVDDDNGRVSVDFRLKNLDLVIPLPRRGDVRH